MDSGSISGNGNGYSDPSSNNKRQRKARSMPAGPTSIIQEALMSMHQMGMQLPWQDTMPPNATEVPLKPIEAGHAMSMPMAPQLQKPHQPWRALQAGRNIPTDDGHWLGVHPEGPHQVAAQRVALAAQDGRGGASGAARAQA